MVGMRWVRSRRWAAVGVCLMLLGIVLWALPGDGRRSSLDDVLEPASWATTIAGFFLAVLAFRQEGARGQREQVHDAVEALARREKAQSENAAERWRLNDPRALSVTWRAAGHVRSDRWVNISQGGAVPDYFSMGGTFVEAYNAYTRIPSGRMVITGKAGSGKTVLTNQLVRRWLDERDAGSRVPVMFRLNNWRPDLSLAEWISDQLAINNVALDRRDPVGEFDKLATRLVMENSVVPVLDGLDEVPQKYRPQLVRAISAYSQPLVVTSRADEYTAAVEHAGVVSQAPVIEVENLALDEAQRYLMLSDRTGEGRGWEPVFRFARAAPQASPVRRSLESMLTTPLLVTLARLVYNDSSRRDPRELLEIGGSNTQESIESHLFDAYFDTVGDSGPYQSARGTRSWNPAKARRWFGHLARSGSRDLAWWEFSNVLGPTTRILLMGLVATPLGGLIALGAYILEDVAYQVCSTGGHQDLATMVSVIYRENDVGAYLVDSSSDLVTGLVLGLCAGSINEINYSGALKGRTPERVRLSLFSGGMQQTPRAAVLGFVREFGTGAGAGLAIGITSLMAFGVIYGLQRGDLSQGFGRDYALVIVQYLASPVARVLSLDSGDGPLVELVAGVTMGAVIGGAYALVNILVHVIGKPTERTTLVSPWDSLATDRTVTLLRAGVVWLVVGAAVGSAGAFANYRLASLDNLDLWHPWAFAVRKGVEYGFLYGSLAALSRILLSAWGAWLLYARLWLPVSGRLPWSPRRAMIDAHDRGVLRQTGAVYQFRHARLRDYLARGTGYGFADGH